MSLVLAGTPPALIQEYTRFFTNQLPGGQLSSPTDYQRFLFHLQVDLYGDTGMKPLEEEAALDLTCPLSVDSASKQTRAASDALAPPTSPAGNN